jgi:DUF1680 family protein
MKTRPYLLLFLFLLLTACAGDKSGNATLAPMEEISLNAVTINDSFWSPRILNNRRVSVPDMIEGYTERGETVNPKLVEAAGYLLQTNDDPALEARMDEEIEKLMTRLLPGGEPRPWKNLLNGEMYSAGHFMEAAVAYHKATGNDRVLEAAVKLADDIDANFGPGKRLDISQHEEIKIGLLKLYHYTGNVKYMELARFFLDERGHSSNGRELYGEYAQDHKPVTDQSEVVGHTVRATYLYTPLAELAHLTGDASYINSVDNLWEDAVHRKTYITGSIGSYRDHEDFGEAYELPNASCWNETCASIGSIFWNRQMFHLHRDAGYIDMMEKVLYNGFLSGVSLDGSHYFYQNPLKSFGGFERQLWFGPNCCPPNVARLIASLGKYIYEKSGEDIWVNLFIGSTLQTSVGDMGVTIEQETGYPWDGNIEITVTPEQSIDLNLYVRVPGWLSDSPVPGDLYSFADKSIDEPVITLNDKIIDVKQENGYMVIGRKWEPGDRVKLALPMRTRMVLSNDLVAENRGMVALQRGPLVYCAEATDNNGDVFGLLVPGDATFKAEYRSDLMGGIVQLAGEVSRVSRSGENIVTEKTGMIAVPYYSWAHRGPGEMSVWLAAEESRAVTEPAVTIASTSTVTSSCGEGSIEDNYPGGNVPDIATRFYPRSQSGSAGFKALYDQIPPVNSFDGSSTYLALRPQLGNEAWVQYDFSVPETVQSVDVYWKDDKQYCQVPESWRLLYHSGAEWVPVENLSDYGVEKDRFNTLTFKPVTTDALRLEIVLQGLDFKKGELGPPDGNYMPEDTRWYETGIIEWQVSR